MLDTGYHRRRTKERLQDPEFQAEYERTRVNPELRTVAALAAALDAEIQIVPRRKVRRRRALRTAPAEA